MRAYSGVRRDGDTSADEPTREDDPYDGMVDEEEPDETHDGPGQGGEASSSVKHQLPTPPVNGLTVAVPVVPRKDDALVATRRPLRSVPPDSREMQHGTKPLPSP